MCAADVWYVCWVITSNWHHRGQSVQQHDTVSADVCILNIQNCESKQQDSFKISSIQRAKCSLGVVFWNSGGIHWSLMTSTWSFQYISAVNVCVQGQYQSDGRQEHPISTCEMHLMDRLKEITAPSQEIVPDLKPFKHADFTPHCFAHLNKYLHLLVGGFWHLRTYPC